MARGPVIGSGTLPEPLRGLVAGSGTLPGPLRGPVAGSGTLQGPGGGARAVAGARIGDDVPKLRGRERKHYNRYYIIIFIYI